MRRLPVSLPRSLVALGWFGAAASYLVPSPEALDPVCPRFLSVDTHSCVHRNHHRELLAFCKHGGNRTLTQDASSGLKHRLGYWTGRDYGQQLIGASGDAGSFHTVMAAIPNRNLGLVVLVSGNGGGAAWGFYSRFLEAEFSAGPSPAAPHQQRLQPEAEGRLRHRFFKAFLGGSPEGVEVCWGRVVRHWGRRR